MTSVRILDADDVRHVLDMASCVDACERAFIAYSAGQAELPGVIHLDVPESGGEIHVKAGHLHGEPFYAVKVASGFAGEHASVIDGLVAVFDVRDGSTAALLLDGGYVTDLRTGAAGGVAARHLAPADVERVAVIGTGAQARMQLDALAVVRPDFTDVRIWGRTPERARGCADDVAQRFGDDVTVRSSSTVDEAVEDAQVVITCTAAREALVRADRLAAGVHVTALGSDGAGKQELDPEIIRRADVLVVDSRDQCATLGELQHAPDQRDRAVELGEVCRGTVEGRTGEDQLTVCDLTGVGVQDVAAANVVMARAGGSGHVVEL
jgi:ornithine cyclodeaminase/alanine dehydrogenase-like protein (mu-crystallin family)